MCLYLFCNSSKFLYPITQNVITGHIFVTFGIFTMNLKTKKECLNYKYLIPDTLLFLFILFIFLYSFLHLCNIRSNSLPNSLKSSPRKQNKSPKPAHSLAWDFRVRLQGFEPWTP